MPQRTQRIYEVRSTNDDLRMIKFFKIRTSKIENRTSYNYVLITSIEIFLPSPLIPLPVEGEGKANNCRIVESHTHFSLDKNRKISLLNSIQHYPLISSVNIAFILFNENKMMKLSKILLFANLAVALFKPANSVEAQPLINEFMAPNSYKRQDDYGGSFENRIRFFLEIFRNV